MEILVWGGGAVLLRGLTRKLKLGWNSLLLFALGLAVAEEFVIQQTSLAPLVTMAAILAILFVLGAIMAWFAWTHIARVKTFHLAIYDPPRLALLAAIVVIGGLFVWGIKFPPTFGRARRPASPAVIALLGGAWGIVWFLLAVLAFGIAPGLSAPAVFAAGAAVVLVILLVLPRWASDAAWTQRHSYYLFTGALTGAMAISFLGFRGAAREDIVFKLATNAIALVLMFLLGRRMAVRRSNAAHVLQS